MRIGNIPVVNNFVLAPMAGITSYPFRLICKEHQCGLVFSEMISAKGLIRNPGEYYKGLLYVSEEERPVAVQLFGSDPETMAEAAALVREAGADIVDINMGCPVPKIIKNRAGAWLMKEPELATRIMERTVQSVDIPVTVKMRKGWEERQEGALDLAERARAAGVAAVSLHGRTVEQYYSGEADWDIIKEVKKKLNIPVIGNGDVFSPGDAARMFEYTGCDGIMIGRAARGNPWIFSRLNTWREGRDFSEEPPLEEKVKTLLYHLELMINLKGEVRAIKEMRRHTGWYLKGVRGAGKARERINRIRTREDFVQEIWSLL